MSKMGNVIMDIQEIVNDNRKTMSFNSIMNRVNEQYGSMFEAIAEEYYNELEGPMTFNSEAYDMESFDDLVNELGLELDNYETF